MMNRFWRNLFLGILLPIGFIAGAYAYYCFHSEGLIPFLIVKVCCLGILIINSSNIYRLYHREGELLSGHSKTKKFRYDCHSHVWCVPNIFFSRYKNIKYLTFLYSLFCSFIVYCLGVVLTTFFIHLHSGGNIVSGDYTFMSLIFGEGAIISFTALVFTIYTLINTKIIKSQQETEIETVEKLFEIIYDKLSIINKKTEKFWELCNEKFIYIYDYTTALGQTSDEIKFAKYRDTICEFITKYDVKYCALINNKEKNTKFYKNKTQFIGMDDNKILQHLVKEQDFYISYINSKLNDKNKCLIYYQPYDPGHIIDAHVDAFYSSRISCREDDTYKQYEIFDKTIFIAQNKDASSVLFVDDLGLTRFLVTNLFVIQFVLGKGNNNKPAPAGFISEDITLIERFKNAFEEYREKIVLG